MLSSVRHGCRLGRAPRGPGVSCVTRSASLTSLSCSFLACQPAVTITAPPVMALSVGASDVRHMGVLGSGIFHVASLSCVAAVCFSGANSRPARSQLLQGVLIKCLPHIVLSPVFSIHRVGIKAGGGCYTEEDRPLTPTHKIWHWACQGTGERKAGR